MIEKQVISQLSQGGVIAYPTEAVFGLGCDPDNPEAIKRLLSVKQRPVEKGLILISDDFDRLVPYVDLSDIPAEKVEWMFSHWPGPFTFVIPKSSKTSEWVAGSHTTIAVRVTSHPIASALCHAFEKPIVSTSANLAGEPAITDLQQLQREIGPKVDSIVSGELGEQNNPSTIIDLVSGKTLRG